MDAAPSSNIVYCAECGRPSTAAELTGYGVLMICSACRSSHAQAPPAPVRPAASAYAGFWIRLVGYLMDGVILGITAGVVQTAILGPMLRIPNIESGDSIDLSVLAPILGLLGIAILIHVAVAACYEGLFVAYMAATPGKLAIGVKVVRPDGSPVGFGRAFARYFAKFLSGMIFCIGFVMVGFDSEKRGLHDIICDTRVVKSRN